jgi:hypothetical protein
MSDNPTPRMDDWMRALGHFLLNFGTLDYMLLLYLQKRLERSEFETLRRKHFNDRAMRLAEYLREAKYPKDKQSEFESLLIGIDQMRDLRNHIAHSHLLMRWEPATDTLVPSASLPKDLDREYSPEVRHVQFAELSAGIVALTKLINAVHDLAGFKPGWTP